MNCETVQNALSAYRDGQTPEEHSRAIATHLVGCRECRRRSEEFEEVRSLLRALPQRPVPPRLNAALRVLASRERVRRLTHRSAGALAEAWLNRCRLWTEDLMRPVALPVAGGLVSAVLLFGMLVPSFMMKNNGGAKDVPMALFTEASVESISPFGFDSEDFVVEVQLDGQGRMVDYTIAEGPAGKDSRQLRRNLENNLIFTRFTPATAFGQPTASKIVVSFSRRQIDVGS